MNKVILIGRLTDDVEAQKKNKTVWANFTLAIREYMEKTTFINCTVFGATAEFMEKFMKKGQRIALEGRIDIDVLEDEEGNKRYFTKVIGQNVEFADGNKASWEKDEETKEKAYKSTYKK